MTGWACVDGNEAAARVAYALSEVVAVYPITPASTMGELADAWSAERVRNLWGSVPQVIEMQSEAGAAGSLHGAAMRGALATTFTASQGLLLMLPNMFKLAGELTPAVIHVAARSIATHALSIFGDHSDVMAARTTGFAMLCAGSVQEAQDFALVAHAATLRSRVPFVHFFDGFRTSHEVAKIALLEDDDLRALVPEELLLAHRARRLTPDHPVLRGSSQNPDVFFQSREAANPFHEAVPGIVQDLFDRLADRTGRRYGVVDYLGHPEAERVIVLMGSGAGAAAEAVEVLEATGERVGLAVVRLYRPFPAVELAAALPATVREIAVLDRTKEPGSVAEPLELDVLAALAEHRPTNRPEVIGGRYGLSSKEFTPAMVKAVFDELASGVPRRHLTVGIDDDVSHTSVVPDRTFAVPTDTVQAVFYGLGSDGTVGANKESVKILAAEEGRFAQGYFVYDSKKSGSVTVSHLRFGPSPIRSTYLVEEADFVACHQFGLLDRMDVLGVARPGATALLNAPYPADEVWAHLPREVQQQIVAKRLRLWTIDADALARDVGLGGRINTIMQTAFFVLSGVLDHDAAVEVVHASIHKSYAKRGDEVVERNLKAADRALHALSEVDVPAEAGTGRRRLPTIVGHAPAFVNEVTARIIAGEGDLLPVSALPADGCFPTGTSQYEKRAIAREIPIWDPEHCIDCGKCTIVCPHAAIRMNVFEPAALEGAPAGFPSKAFRSRDLPGHLLNIQVSPDDCTGCGVCVDVCPAAGSLSLEPVRDHAEVERERFRFSLAIPELDRSALPHDTVKGTQVLRPLFEFPGACAGCGETPYLKLLSQLFGDRMIVANATGCSSIYGGNLPTTPWAVDDEGRGPAWANSLFEDNAEFGLGIRVGQEAQEAEARRLLSELAPLVGHALASDILDAEQTDDAGVAAQRHRVAELRTHLRGIEHELARRLDDLADELVRKSVWIVGGDGWAYDIGFGGLDHVLASGRDVNILVLDTEVYSNTGGQASKATPRGAVAKFAAAGKRTRKKDLGAIARAYGNVYVAQIALGGSDIQTVKALQEADAWPGPSLVIAYSTCIAHGIDMAGSMTHQKEAVRSGYWPLYRYHPAEDEHGHPFHLDSKAPSMSVQEFTAGEGRFASLAREHPEAAEHLALLEQADVDDRWRYYEQLAGVERSMPGEDRPEP